MKKLIYIVTAAMMLSFNTITMCYAQMPIGDKWYQNPIGFEPLNLHTSMGFIIPTIVTGAALLLTRNNGNLHNKMNIYSEMGTTFGYKHPFSTIQQSNTGVDVMIRKWLSIGAEFSVTLPFDEYNTATGISLRPFARFHIMNKQHYRLWFESGGGLICFTNTFPKPTENDERNGTVLNGITKYGIGTSVRITNQLQVIAGIRHLHISNGNRKGVERNPSHDSNGLFAGLSWNINKDSRQ